jgi:pilus assembly protein CpaE
MSARLLLISADTGIARAVRGALASAASLLQIRDLAGEDAAVGEKFQPSMVLVDSAAGVGGAFERITAAKRQFPAVPVVAMGNEMSAQLVLAAMRAGADDFLDREAAPDEWQAVLEKGLRKAPAGAPGRAGMIAILSGRPSEQDQDFALNLAVRAARRKPEAMTLYLDLAQPMSQAGIALGLELKFGIGDAIREIARLDREFLESAAARCPRSGLYVMALTGAGPPDGESLPALLQILRGIFDTIVINLETFSHTLPPIAAAQYFLCCNPRFSSIRAAADLLRRLDKISPRLVIHDLAPGRSPRPADIRKALGVDESIDLEAGWDELAVHLNEAKPLALGASRYARGLDHCLAALESPAPAQPGLRTMLGRWLRREALS